MTSSHAGRDGERLFRETRALVEVESPTGAEGPVMDLAERLLAESGLAVRSMPVAPGRRNLLATPPRDGPGGVRVLLSTHLDVVPPHVPFSEDAEFLLGRGSCDAKGIAAAMMEAARRLLAAGEEGFGLLLLVGEEVDNAGARAAARELRAEAVIAGEPTRNQLARGHKGVIVLRLHAEGEAAHSAYPERGDSAIHRLLDALGRIRAADFGRDAVLGPATVNVGKITGGVAGNVLAPEARADIVFRVVIPLEEMERRIEACLPGPDGRRDSRLRAETIARLPPTYTEGMEGLPETVVAFGTDVPFLKEIGPTWLIGPGDILDAHTPGEKVRRSELLEGASIYETMARRLLRERG